jgi:hypothetical protein
VDRERSVSKRFAVATVSAFGAAVVAFVAFTSSSSTTPAAARSGPALTAALAAAPVATNATRPAAAAKLHSASGRSPVAVGSSRGPGRGTGTIVLTAGPRVRGARIHSSAHITPFAAGIGRSLAAVASAPQTGGGPIAHAASLVTITAAASGSGSAYVTDRHSHCWFRTSCNAYTGDSISISEAPDSGNRFNGWSGGTCSGTDNPCTFNASETETDTASFATQATVSVGTSGSGTVTLSDANTLAGCSNVTSCLAALGDSVTLTATPASGYRFTGWSGGSHCSATTNPCTFTVSGAEAYTASFVKTVMITAAVGGSGSARISDSNALAGCANVTSCLADVGDKITITPTASSGNRFTGWSGGTCTGTTSPCVINSLAAAETDTANFAQTITISTSASGKGTVTVTDANTADASCKDVTSCLADVGDKITVTANPDSGNQWSAWSGGSCATSKLNPCTFTAAKSETDGASFVLTPTINVTATSGPEGVVTISDSNPAAGCQNATHCVVAVGDNLTLTITAKAGFSLASLSGAACSGTPVVCTLTNVTANTAIAATFALKVAGSPALAVFVSPNGNDANPGTQALPVLTPQRAIDLVASSGGAKNQIRLAQGSYSGGLSLTSADSGIQIYGGFDPTSWAATLSPGTATTISGAPQAVLANGAAGVLLQELDLIGNAPGGGSTSAYGVRAISGSSLTLSDVSVVAGNGGNGANGADGAAGPAGNPGGNGGPGETPAQVVAKCLTSGGSTCASVDGVGGTAGTGANGNDYYYRYGAVYKRNPILHARVLAHPTPAAGPSAGDGGFGGYGNTGGSSTPQGCTGSGSAKACGPEAISSKTKKAELIGLYYGGLGSTSFGVPSVAAAGDGGANGFYNPAGDGNPGSNGKPGASGTAGADGSAGTNPLSPGDTWTTGDGSSGADGTPGAGGGGGGGGGGGFGNVALAGAAVVYGSGNGGGGGGGGGMGGTSGAGGVGGGGSFGLYLDGNSTVAVQNGSSIVAGNGGNGGNGGAGGNGGKGGAGGNGATNGVPNEGAGGDGGNGGNGGPGGAGGGGAGGPSFAVFKADGGSTTQLGPDTALSSGTAGSGGAGGSPGSPAGQHGGGGASEQCFGGCGFVGSVPVVFPAYALLSGRSLEMEIACTTACRGKGSLLYTRSGSARGGRLVASFSFHLTGRGLAKVQSVLTAAGQRLVHGKKHLLVRVSISVATLSARRQTFTSALALTRSTPPGTPRHKRRAGFLARWPLVIISG